MNVDFVSDHECSSCGLKTHEHFDTDDQAAQCLLEFVRNHNLQQKKNNGVVWLEAPDPFDPTKHQPVTLKNCKEWIHAQSTLYRYHWTTEEICILSIRTNDDQ